MAARISRAKQRIKAAGSSFGLPDGEEREERLRVVLHVLYLIFNGGYTASSGSESHRPDLARKAIRLTRMVHAQLPEDGEVAGLLALMLLTHARREARTTTAGDLVPLDEQDRAKWDRGLIDEGTGLVKASLAAPALGPYQLQATSGWPGITGCCPCGRICWRRPATRPGHTSTTGAPRSPPPASPSNATWSPGPAG
ncbi:MAG TPA: DUF6596 domain-containing protein [Streptosporangiaceae bacterium]|nr:DUF6596 domain-containing protein [Streptosporangiaceae bacterium]